MRLKIQKNVRTSFRLLNCYVFCLVGLFCQAQDDDLLGIINSNRTNEIKQIQIDSFLVSNEKKTSPRGLADNYHEVAKWYYNTWWDTGAEIDIQKAIDYTSKSLGLKKELSILEEGSLEKTAFNLGTFYYFKGDFYKALDSYKFLVDKGKDTEMIQDAKLELGSLYMELGDFYKALDQFNDIAITYDTSDSKSNIFNLLDAFILQAETYSKIDIKEFSDEIQLNLDKADSLILQTKDADDTEMHYKKRRIDQFKGNWLLEIGEYEQAVGFHQKVLADSLNLYPDELSRVYNSIAFSQIKLKNFDKAVTALNQAIAKDKNYSAPYENFGDYYLAQNEFKKGLYQYQKAIVYATDKNQAIKYEELPSVQDLEFASEKILLLNHIVTKANGWLKYFEDDKNQEHLMHSLETFALADELVDIIRSESTEYQSKLFWREKGASLYAKAVEVCFLLNKPEEAYYFMERNKALLLLEDVTSEQAKEIAQLPQSMIKREYELKQAIFLAENELQNSILKSQDTLSILKLHVYESKQRFNTFVDSLGTVFPEYAKIKKKVDLLPYKTFKEKFVSKDEVVLQYILNNEQGYGLMTSTKRTHFFELDNAKLINEDLVSLYSQLTDMTSNREKMASYAELSHSVFQKLIPQEVYAEINGKKLTIISDYILQQIPFESFVVDKEKIYYLIEDVEIRYAYSMSYLNAKRKIKQNPEKEFLGLAPVQFASLGLPELAFSGIEISEINKIFDGRIALNKAATKSTLFANLNGYKIVHLSTHADVGKDGNPWIAFSDEKLFLNEIYANKNQADMVVLSGCNTSLGELKKGEGAMSLARGFFHSGAKSVVSSLWTINDKTSKDLITSFYKSLDAGMTKSAALRKAKIDYIEKYRGTTVSPSFWAALVVIGDNSSINSGDNSWPLWIWGIFGILSVPGIYFFIRRTNANS